MPVLKKTPIAGKQATVEAPAGDLLELKGDLTTEIRLQKTESQDGRTAMALAFLDTVRFVGYDASEFPPTFKIDIHATETLPPEKTEMRLLALNLDFASKKRVKARSFQNQVPPPETAQNLRLKTEYVKSLK